MFHTQLLPFLLFSFLALSSPTSPPIASIPATPNNTTIVLPPTSSIPSLLHIVSRHCQKLPLTECVALEKYTLLSITHGLVSQSEAGGYTYHNSLGSPFLFHTGPIPQTLQKELSCGLFETSVATSAISETIVVDKVGYSLQVTNQQSMFNTVNEFCQLHGMLPIDCNTTLRHFGTLLAAKLHSRLTARCGLQMVSESTSINTSTNSWFIRHNAGIIPHAILLRQLQVTIPYPLHHSVVLVPPPPPTQPTQPQPPPTFRVHVRVKTALSSTRIKHLNPIVVVRFSLQTHDSDTAKITTLGQNQAKNTITQQSGPWRLTTLTNQSIYFGLKSHTEFGTLGVVTAVVQIGAWVGIEQDRQNFDTNDSTLLWGKPTYSTFDVLPKSIVQPWTPMLQWPTFTLPSQPRRRLRLTHVTQFNAVDGQSHVLLRTAMGMPAEEFDILFVSSEPFAPNSTSVSNLLRHNIGVVHAPVVVDENLVHQYFNDGNNYEQAIDTLVQELEHAITALLESSSASGKPQQSCENLPPSLWKLIGPLTHSLAGSDIVTFTNVASLTAQDAIIGLAAKCAGVPVVVCDPGNLNHALPTLKGVTALVVPSHVAAAHWQRMFDRHRVVNIPIKVAQPGASVAVLQSSTVKESNTFIIAFIGRLAQTKNPSVFVRVAKEILNKGYQGKKIQFWIIGDGALKSILKQMTIELGLDKEIVFKGSVPHEQVLEHLSNKDIHLVLHTTLTNETFCLSNVEAMAAGVPVVTYGVGGVADYLRKPKKEEDTSTTFAAAHGFVVHPPTVKAMANVVIDVLKKGPVYFEKIKQNGLRYVKTHGLLEQHMVERFSHIYKSLVFKEEDDSAPALTTALTTNVQTAIAAGTTLSKAAAELHHQLIELNPKDAFRSAVPLYDRATRLFRGVPLNEWWSGGTTTDQYQTMTERNLVAMKMLQHRRKTVLPEIIRLGQQKWLDLQRTQDSDGIATNTPHGNDLWPGNFDSRGNFYLTTLHKLMHDAEQLRYNVEKGIMPTLFLQVADNYTQVHRLLATKSGVKNVNAYVFLNAFALETIGTTYNWMNHQSHVPKIPTSFTTETLSTVVRSDGSVGERNQVNAQLGTALHASTNFEEAEQEYYSNARAPGLTVIDNFLSPQALKNMLHFLQASTIWFDVKNGYLGAYFNAGLSTPLLSQIEDELRIKMPRVIGNLSLNTVWAYKCTNASPEGLAIHADMAAVNINLWLTPTESNLNGGGLIVYLTRDEQLPKNWNFTSMNYFDEFSIKKMRNFVRDTNSQKFEVEYRQNRATVFHSRLFHESSTFKLKQGYKNSRINLTFLFGSPNLDKKLTTW